mmetsp:Transcript_2659/g.6650  ORF Transcript_2659/g.6650 Transcript_2659/m.6650 type:complete len:243 (-) Transcript_2659:103-831(-)
MGPLPPALLVLLVQPRLPLELLLRRPLLGNLRRASLLLLRARHLLRRRLPLRRAPLHVLLAAAGEGVELPLAAERRHLHAEEPAVRGVPVVAAVGEPPRGLLLLPPRLLLGGGHGSHPPRRLRRPARVAEGARDAALHFGRHAPREVREGRRGEGRGEGRGWEAREGRGAGRQVRSNERGVCAVWRGERRSGANSGGGGERGGRWGGERAVRRGERRSGTNSGGGGERGEPRRSGGERARVA